MQLTSPRSAVRICVSALSCTYSSGVERGFSISNLPFFCVQECMDEVQAINEYKFMRFQAPSFPNLCKCTSMHCGFSLYSGVEAALRIPKLG